MSGSSGAVGATGGNTPSAEFAVGLPLYSGPFSVLADLILDQQMDVCDVPVARVTDAFLLWGAQKLGGWSLEEATWFLAVCAVLLEMKVGRLLPRQVVQSEEDLLGGTSPDLVYARSLELAAFRRISASLAESIALASLSIPRTAGPPSELSHLYPDVLEKVTAEDLMRTAAAVLAPSPDLDLTHVTPIRASMSDALEALRVRLTAQPQARFRELLDGCEERIQVVIRFLAILELYREGKVELTQARLFGDIEVRWQGSTGDAGGDSRAGQAGPLPGETVEVDRYPDERMTRPEPEGEIS